MKMNVGTSGYVKSDEVTPMQFTAIGESNEVDPMQMWHRYSQSYVYHYVTPTVFHIG